jgi:hypothetical protein
MMGQVYVRSSVPALPFCNSLHMYTSLQSYDEAVQVYAPTTFPHYVFVTL